MFSKIVHPTDFSDESLPALEAAHKLAAALHAELMVCFLAHPPLAAQGDTLTDPGTGETRDIAVELEARQPSRPDVKRQLQILITESSTRVKKLLGFLEDMGADLLVLGMHRRSGIAGWLGPSITEEVVRNAHCAVLVVKQPGEDPGMADGSGSVIDEDSAAS
jgi:nucleotide-binding universal stress UspA family protein